MINRNLKITPILAILMTFFFISCEKTEYNTDLIFASKDNFLYKTETAFCQRNPDEEIWSKSFKYDENGNKTEEITYRMFVPATKTISVFNQNNQPASDSVFYYAEDHWRLDHFYSYIYRRNLL